MQSQRRPKRLRRAAAGVAEVLLVTPAPAGPRASKYEADFGNMERRAPSEVVVARTVEDVQTAVQRALRQGRRAVARGHGCSSGGLCVTDQMLIDVTGLDRMKLRSRSLVTVEGGKRMLTLQAELTRQGLSCVVMGDSPGATLGGFLSVGGFGSASALHGAAVHSVTALDIVTGKGELVRAEPTGEHADLFRYALSGLGQCGIIVRADLRVREHAPYWRMRGRSFDESTTIGQLNDFVEAMKPWDHLFLAFDIGTRRWRVMWAQEEQGRPSLLRRDLLGNLVCRTSHHLAPLLGYPLTAGDAYGEPNLAQRAARWALGSAQARDRAQRMMETLIDRARDGVIVKNAYNLLNQGAESFVQGVTRANVAAGRARNFSELKNLWNDFLVPTEHAQAFFCELNRLFADPITTRGHWGTVIANPSHKFNGLPLCPIPRSERINTFGPYCSVPLSLVANYRKRFDQARELCLQAGGRVYLFGYHPKTEAFYRRQFGDTVVDAWKRVKTAYDPGNVMGAPILDA